VSDPRTIGVYDARADDYVEMTRGARPRDPLLDEFVAACAPGARVLDLGCGPGREAARMAAAGLRVDAVDASAEMVARAARHPGVQARQATFDDIGGTGIYGGVWANFSLLHAAREDMPRHLEAIHRALVPGGVFHIGVKTGTGAARDGIGRLYTYFGEDELTGLLERAGFTMDARHAGHSTGLAGEPADWLVLRTHA
jgi:SAM-dependent methyltransferase